MMKGSIHQKKKKTTNVHILHANPKYVPNNRGKRMKHKLIKLKEQTNPQLELEI